MVGGGVKVENASGLRQQVKRLCASQRLCVLSTQYEGQPYSSLVAFAETDELRSLIFVTSRNSRKYAYSMANRKVAMMIDNRTNQTSDFNSALAVTAIGTVEEVTGNGREEVATRYIAKHPYLAEFVSRPGQALMRITVTEYIIACFDRVQVIHIDD
jgi:nitroimidazol reductase NimA-like FMN-containing flavoprotein (pyridoxamine 5'-phosphate oxidase superfamily)